VDFNFAASLQNWARENIVVDLRAAHAHAK